MLDHSDVNKVVHNTNLMCELGINPDCTQCASNTTNPPERSRRTVGCRDSKKTQDDSGLMLQNFERFNMVSFFSG